MGKKRHIVSNIGEGEGQREWSTKLTLHRRDDVYLLEGELKCLKKQTKNKKKKTPFQQVFLIRYQGASRMLSQKAL